MAISEALAAHDEGEQRFDGRQVGHSYHRVVVEHLAGLLRPVIEIHPMVLAGHGYKLLHYRLVDGIGKLVAAAAPFLDKIVLVQPDRRPLTVDRREECSRPVVGRPSSVVF